VVLSIPVLLVMGGLLVFFLRHDELRISHLLVAALLGAQISTTGVAGEVNTLFTAANHLISTVFTTH
jgi:hypothetical protein